jgi:Ca-activated chloride channel family protein
MKTTVALAIIALYALPALPAAPATTSEIVVGLSPLQPAAERTNQQCLLQRFLLGQCPTSTRVVIWDAWQLQVVSDIQPFQLNYDSPAARAPRLASALAALARWSAGTSAAQVPASLKDSAAIKVPEWIDALAAAPAAGRRTVVILASPFCLVPDEPTFSMVHTRYPSDAHLARTSADSIYGTADRLGHLANTTVLWAYGSENLWASQHHRERVTRWWYLFTAAQGPNAALAGFSSDAPQILREALRADHSPIAHYAVDPSDAVLAMHIAAERQVPVEVQQVPPAPTLVMPTQKPSPPPTKKVAEASPKPVLPPPPPKPRPEPKPEHKPEPKPAPVQPPAQVTLNVGVTDSTSTPTSGLSKADFTVLEDGVQQSIASFSADRAPISLVVLLDTSGSMASKLDRIRAAASIIIHQAGDQDEFCLVEFKANVGLVQDFTSDSVSADRALATLKAGGQTALLDALKFALEHASQNGRHERKGLVLITDGGEADSHSTRANVLPLLQRANVQFYAVGFPEGLDRPQSPDSRGHGPIKPQPTEALARDLLDTLAKASSGGRVFYPPKAADLGRIAQSIVSDLRAPRYTLGYYPIRPPTEAGWRSVQVLVLPSAQHGPLTARTRAGYFPSPAGAGNVTGAGTANTTQLTP